MGSQLQNLSLNEKNFITQGVEENVRLDGRKRDDGRHVGIDFAGEDGAVTVNFGQTKVFCKVFAEIIQPRDQRSTEGRMEVNVELNPMASPEFEPGRRVDRAIELSVLAERVLRDSRAVDLETLCLVPGKKVWSIRVVSTVLSDDGNILDVLVFGSLLALRHFRLPDTRVDGDEVLVYDKLDREPIALSFHILPFAVSLVFLRGGGVVLDATLKEEQAGMDGITFALSPYRELCAINKTGGTQMPQRVLMECILIAEARVEVLQQRMEAALSDALGKRIQVALDRAAKRGGTVGGF